MLRIVSRFEYSRTVFISYRRGLASYAVWAIYSDLQRHGYDVFLDVANLGSGKFEQIIMNEIAARAHFIVVLSPGAMERFSDPADLFRREIEEAIKLERNIIPFLIEGFRFEKKDSLTGTLEALPSYQHLNVNHEWFQSALDRLRDRYLSEEVHCELRFGSEAEQQIIREHVADMKKRNVIRLSKYPVAEDEWQPRTIESNVKTAIQFSNMTKHTVQICWLDQDRNRKLYRNLDPSQSYIQGTFVTHPWLVTKLDGTSIALFMPDSSFGEAIISDELPRIANLAPPPPPF